MLISVDKSAQNFTFWYKSDLLCAEIVNQDFGKRFIVKYKVFRMMN